MSLIEALEINMQTQLVVGGDKITIGDKCVITKVGTKNGYGLTNTLLSVWGFKKGAAGKPLIGLHNPIYNIGWGSLNDNVQNGHGLWVNPVSFTSDLHLISKTYKICTNFMFKRQNLRAMHCRILCICDDENVFVEFDKDIGGGSCDGLGKTGHCIMLPRRHLIPIRSENRSSNC